MFALPSVGAGERGYESHSPTRMGNGDIDGEILNGVHNTAFVYV